MNYIYLFELKNYKYYFIFYYYYKKIKYIADQ